MVEFLQSDALQIAIGVCLLIAVLMVALAKAAGRADEETERDAQAKRVVMEMERTYWKRRHPSRYWPGA